MPIKGLTDRGMSFPEIGQIRKGAAKTDKGFVGQDLTYFRAEFADKETETSQIFTKAYGNQPNEIRIILPFNEIERMWEAWLEAYTAGRMVARSDGEKFIFWIDTNTGEVKVKNGEPYMPYKEGMVVGHDFEKKPIYCKPAGRLKVILPELARAAYMTVLTTSVHDIANISEQLEAFKALNNGQIAGIPLVLRRRPKKISRPDSKDKTKRVRTVKSLLSIEADPIWVKAKLQEVKSLALPGNGMALLPEPEPEQVIEAEYENIEEDLDDNIPSSPQMEHTVIDIEPTAAMSLEAANSVKNRDGVEYGTIDTKTLSTMANSLTKVLNKNDVPPDEREQKTLKLDAIKIILAARNESK